MNIDSKILHYCENQNFHVIQKREHVLICLDFFSINIEICEGSLNLDFGSLLKKEESIRAIEEKLKLISREVKHIRLGTKSLFRSVGVDINAKKFVNLVVQLAHITDTISVLPVSQASLRS